MFKGIYLMGEIVHLAVPLKILEIFVSGFICFVPSMNKMMCGVGLLGLPQIQRKESTIKNWGMD
jgi:hypothetical protein